MKRETDLPDVSGVPPEENFDGGGGKGCGTEQCPRCNLYGWYPPLLLLSTAMAGIFCWMYVTKPVFLSPSSSGNPASINPAVDHREGGPFADGVEPKTASVPARAETVATMSPRRGVPSRTEPKAVRLDPELATLPGESPSALPSAQELEPLRPASRGLFRPLEPAEVAEAAPPDNAPIISDSSGGPIRIERSESVAPIRIVQRAPEETEAEESLAGPDGPDERDFSEAMIFADSESVPPIPVGPVLTPGALEWEMPLETPETDIADRMEGDVGPFSIGASFLSEIAGEAPRAMAGADDEVISALP